MAPLPGVARTVRPGRAIALGTIAVAVLTLLVVLAVEAPGLDVVAHGQFVEYTANEVDRVRAGHWFTFLAANIGWLAALGPFARKIDVLDAIPVAAFVWSFRDVLRSSAAAVWFWSAGLALFVFTLVLEVAAATPVEDAIEVVASTSVLLGFVAIAAQRLGREDPPRG